MIVFCETKAQCIKLSCIDCKLIYIKGMEFRILCPRLNWSQIKENEYKLRE